jgi:hypothetical protein
MSLVAELLPDCLTDHLKVSVMAQRDKLGMKTLRTLPRGHEISVMLPKTQNEQIRVKRE